MLSSVFIVCFSFVCLFSRLFCFVLFCFVFVFVFFCVYLLGHHLQLSLSFILNILLVLSLCVFNNYSPK